MAIVESLKVQRTKDNKFVRLTKTLEGRSTRRHPVIQDLAGHHFLKAQKRDRWPDQATEDKYAELNRAKRPRRKPGKVKPAQGGFTLLDAVIDKGKALNTLLTAASLQLKRVRRYPGYVLIHTYNLKNRPIEII